MVDKGWIALIDSNKTTITIIGMLPERHAFIHICAIILCAADDNISIGGMDRNAEKLRDAERVIDIGPGTATIWRRPDTAIIADIKLIGIIRSEREGMKIGMQSNIAATDIGPVLTAIDRLVKTYS